MGQDFESANNFQSYWVSRLCPSILIRNKLNFIGKLNIRIIIKHLAFLNPYNTSVFHLSPTRADRLLNIITTKNQRWAICQHFKVIFFCIWADLNNFYKGFLTSWCYRRTPYLWLPMQLDKFKFKEKHISLTFSKFLLPERILTSNRKCCAGSITNIVVFTVPCINLSQLFSLQEKPITLSLSNIWAGLRETCKFCWDKSLWNLNQ